MLETTVTRRLPIYTNSSRVASAGFGAFAARALEAGEFVGEYVVSECSAPLRLSYP
eukprot:SAG11_NODE_3369_length_2493_cov_2.073935_5_plen_56_part_00